MMKRILFALLALISSQMAVAANQKPPDVPAYVTTTATYQSGTTVNVLGDNSTTWGGTPPAYATMPADPNPSAPPTGWVVTSAVSYCDNGVVNNGTHGCTNGYTGGEAKMRTVANVTHILFDDPIRNYAEPGTSHCHEFFGNRSVNAYSTYSTLRNRPASFAGGGPANGTGYWFPCPVKTNPFSNGKNYAVKANFITVYYTANPYTLSAQLTRIPRGLRYVLGVNMDDPDDNVVKAEIATANAQSGTAGRYSYRDNGLIGWYCYTSGGALVGTVHSSLKNSDGSDPWGGACTAGGDITVQIQAPACWDGVNLWAPGGYKHLRQEINDNVTGTGVCPNGWYRLPQLAITPHFSHQGFSDYGNWRLSSDDAAATASGHAVLNGASFHTDWLGGWNDALFLGWQQFCSGVNGNTSHECNYSTISATQRLITDAAPPVGSRTTQVDTTTTYNTSNQAQMFQIPATSNGPVTIIGH